jgi:putative endopeptidase
MRYLLLLCTVACASAPAAAPPPTPAPTPAPSPLPPPPPEQVSLADVGLHGAWLDTTADPCTDFPRYACGGFVAHAEIAPDHPTAGTAADMNDVNEALLHEILDGAAPGTQLGDLYGSCMDEAAVETAGVAPLRPLLDAIAKVKDERNAAAAIATLHLHGIRAFFRVTSDMDLKDAKHMLLDFGQSGLGLPERDYYFRDDDKSKKLRAAYGEHVGRTLVLAGLPASSARDVIALETELARVSLDAVARRDAEKQYHPMERDALVKTAPGFPWADYLKAIGEDSQAIINVENPAFMTEVDKLLAKTPAKTVRAYLVWTTVRTLSGILPKRFVDERFTMERLTSGQKEQQPRWKRCTHLVDSELGEVLGQPFVARAFGADGKALAEKMVHAIADAMDHDLDEVTWMDPETRAKAKDKLHAMAFLIGYPDKWREYAVNIDRAAYGKNVLALRAFNTRWELDKAGKPTDRFEWHMTPPTVNAYNSEQRVEMVFPAGILQPPFFSAHSSMVVNLGHMGSIVGHELTHGFDDQGAKYDPNGNLIAWWPQKVVDAFQERTNCVVQQYDSYEALPGLHVNGKLTLGENIADIGGLKLAYRAMRALRDGARPQIAGGYTEDQQFFIAYGQGWCQKATDEYTRMRVQTNPHTPSMLRIVGATEDVPAFAEAFHCGKKEPRCTVW